MYRKLGIVAGTNAHTLSIYLSKPNPKHTYSIVKWNGKRFENSRWCIAGKPRKNPCVTHCSINIGAYWLWYWIGVHCAYNMNFYENYESKSKRYLGNALHRIQRIFSATKTNRKQFQRAAFCDSNKPRHCIASNCITVAQQNRCIRCDCLKVEQMKEKKIALAIYKQHNRKNGCLI